MASLFQACKTVVRNQASDTLNIGGYDIGLELYHQSDIDDDAYGDVTFGDNDESKIVVVADDTITIPSGYTLTPDSPKKSLVLFCNNLVNNGTISMYQKAPNVLPHDYYILESSIAGTARNIVIPAYANNQIPRKYPKDLLGAFTNGENGNNGTNRQCGSGGTGTADYYHEAIRTSTAYWKSASGSGYAFGGGAGGAASSSRTGENNGGSDVDTTYPMRGGNTALANTWGYNEGGVGNPVGIGYNTSGYIVQNFGCGGRIIVFCNSFTNNGIITVNGTATATPTKEKHFDHDIFGGASGAGAVDIFYTNLLEQGTITANGGGTFTKYSRTPGAGGNGSITLTQWTQNKIVKETIKYFSRSNVNYLLTQMAERIKDSRMGE